MNSITAFVHTVLVFTALVHLSQEVPPPECEGLTCPYFGTECDCGNNCPKTCADPNATPCIVGCLTSCECKEGYVQKDRESGECVPVAQCPGNPSNPGKLGCGGCKLDADCPNGTVCLNLSLLGLIGASLCVPDICAQICILGICIKL